MIQKLVLFNNKSKRDREKERKSKRKRARTCKSSCSVKRALKRDRREKSNGEETCSGKHGNEIFLLPKEKKNFSFGKKEIV